MLRSEGESPKLRQTCQRSSCGASPDQRLSRKLWVAFVWSPLFSCSPTLLLVSPRLSREIQGILAVAGMRLVVAAHARGRALSDVSAPRWEFDQWFSQGGVVDGWATRGPVKLGRTHVQARDVARVCVCGALTLLLRAIIAKGDQLSCLPSRAEEWRIDSLRNLLELKYVQRSSCPTVTLSGTRAL